MKMEKWYFLRNSKKIQKSVEIFYFFPLTTLNFNIEGPCLVGDKAEAPFKKCMDCVHKWCIGTITRFICVLLPNYQYQISLGSLCFPTKHIQKYLKKILKPWKRLFNKPRKILSNLWSKIYWWYYNPLIILYPPLYSRDFYLCWGFSGAKFRLC